MDSVTIVTAANEDFKIFLGSLLGSLLNFGIPSGARVVVFDCGLSEATRSAIRTLGIAVVAAPPAPVQVPGVPDYYRAMTLRPSLPDLLAPSDYIIWLDADCWVQSASIVQDFISAARNREIACAIELDRSYNCFSEASPAAPYNYGQGKGDFALFEQWVTFYEPFYQPEEARRLAAYPLINAGAFCASAASPMWSRWNQLMIEFMTSLIGRLSPDPLLRRLQLLADQTALNAMLRTNDCDVAHMPATYNWMCHRALPLYNEHSALMVERCWPFDPIQVVHLTTSFIKETRRFNLDTLEGVITGRPDRVERSMLSPHAIRL